MVHILERLDHRHTIHATQRRALHGNRVDLDVTEKGGNVEPA
jgi:hypothetical protein